MSSESYFRPFVYLDSLLFCDQTVPIVPSRASEIMALNQGGRQCSNEHGMRRIAIDPFGREYEVGCHIPLSSSVVCLIVSVDSVK